MLLGVLVGVLVLSFAVDRVGVDLEEAQSDTRQAQLQRIVRVLARPALTTTDIGETTIVANVAVPCGPDAEGTAQEEAGAIVVEPPCADPGATVTVTGTGFEPGAEGDLEFVPDSEFTVVRKIADFTAGRDGAFSVEVTLPNRPSDAVQQLQAVIEAPLGTWGNRVEVWTDTNDNGIRDVGVIGTDGLDVTVEGVSAGRLAVGLIDPASQLVFFAGEEAGYTPTEGPANGQAAVGFDEVSGDGLDVEVTAITSDDGTATFTVVGPEGSDVSAWRAVLYDIDADAEIGSYPLGDEIRVSPRVSDEVVRTIDKIIDTVLLALVATLAGLSLAIPLSFVAARNLMRDIQVPVLNLGIGLLLVPLGALVGSRLMHAIRAALASLPGGGAVAAVALVVLGVTTLAAARAVFLRLPERSWGKVAGVVVVGALALATMDRLAVVLLALHDAVRPSFGRWGFLPGLLDTVAQVVALLLGPLAMMLLAGVFVAAGSRIAYRLRDRLPTQMRRGAAFLLVATGGAVWAIGVGAILDWLYLIDDATLTVWIPAAVGAVIGSFLAWRGLRSGEVRVGLVLYYIARTIFNTLRSIEPLVMVIVFVIWVGFGEFAGSLALAVHTAAALAKLYSEQVESISQGPLEAVKASGATRLQQVVYAVVPQVVPPYISFTMYRWDINVRMSTILGFAGGGGIGSILQQNLTLGNYRAASVQMLAITIVVATMDYLSARLRERLL